MRVALVQGSRSHEKVTEELRFMKSIARGILDICDGNVLTMAETKILLSVESLKVVVTRSSPSDTPIE